MPDVHVPGIGNVPRGGLIAGMVLGVGGGLYLWYKHKENASATTTTPNTGYGYGNQYGYGGYGYSNPAFNEPYISGEYGYGGAYGYGIGEGYGVGSSTPPTTPVQLATTNAAWAQAAENYLVNTGDYDAATVAAALGVYIAGSTVSTAQQSIVEAAIAFEGYPPDAGPNGYPPSMKTSPSTGQGTGATGTPVATVPNVVGMDVDDAVGTLQRAGFKDQLTLIRKAGHTYIVTSQSPKAGTSKATGSTITINAKLKS